MDDQESVQALHGNAYNLFIIVLTILSLSIMVLLLLPLSEATIHLLEVYDGVICIVFLIDFAINLRRAPTKRDYFIGQRGWLDLIGSLPTLGILRYAALLRLARLSRLARITKLTRNKEKHEIVADVLQNRGSYALFITTIMALTVLTVCGAGVLQAESRSSEANIVTGADALWWSIVTLTTVGYGDYYPVTGAGRIIGVVVMVSGVGIIASLASMLTSLLIPPAVAASPSSTRSQDAVPAGTEHRAELLDEAH